MRGCLFDAPGIYYFHLLHIDNLFHIIFFRAIRQAPITPASPPNREERWTVAGSSAEANIYARQASQAVKSSKEQFLTFCRQ